MAADPIIGIAGAGAWGTALAVSAARTGAEVRLWGRDKSQVEAIAQTRENARYLPGIPLDRRILPSADLGCLEASDLWLLAVPAQTLRALASSLPVGRQPLILCAKGLERASELPPSRVVGEVLPGRSIAVLSGPNFAREVAAGLPAAATLATADQAQGQAIARSLSHPAFRLYWTDDVAGVEIGGAVKNVLAIAAGIVVGKGLGENAAAALITRGLAELMRLGQALGGRPSTLMGLAGLGDLLLTAGSLTSRNMAFGHAIGKGADPEALMATPGKLVEGAFTAGAVVRLATRHGIELPICAAVDAILAGRSTIEAALAALMNRPLRAEAVPRD
jgi:glycerol-3-phosphate dehydrogenase (NAD(P)+)